MPDEKEKFNLPEREEKILKFWEENKIFEKSLEKTKKGKTFVFYEGPPTANGMPGVHHALARAFKDVVLRYKTMRGFFVPRRAGWDTHGLPVEIEVEKALGFKTKQDIEKYGIGKFNQKAKESVWKYKDEWEKATKRLGFWLDLENPYITYETSYIETLWWVIKEIWKKGLLYKDFKSLPWCPRCGTGLSSHELGLGYRKVKDDSIFVKLKIKGRANEYLLVWTTTPWTLSANVAVAVNSKIEYSKFKIGSDYIWSVSNPPSGSGERVFLMEKLSGSRLVDLEYEPLFKVPAEYSAGGKPPYKVFAADFVSTEDGTGMVHIASAFGEDDLELMKKAYAPEPYPILQTVNPDGTMKKGVIGEGKFIKEADKLIIEDLKKRKLLSKVEPYEHEYPFCWRCATPLIYFAKESWWIKMSALREKLLQNNEKINWIPEHVKHGRFGEFLKEVRDWAFSRERYWGTPLPIWQCKKCNHAEVIGSRGELYEKSEKSKNRYLVMRHGEAVSNIKNIVSYARDGEYHLTLRGRKQVENAAKKLKETGVDFIYASDVLRTKETAEIVGKVLEKKTLFDKRLREINTGIFGGQEPDAYHKFFASRSEMFFKRPPNGETLTELRKRVLEFIEDMEKRYSGKTILVVSHEYPLWMLYAGASGLSNEEALRLHPRGKDLILYADVMGVNYKRLPRDEDGNVDFHRPYVDDFLFPCKKCGGKMQRIPEVADVWFDSGSMPWASQTGADLKTADKRRKILHGSALGENRRRSGILFPADYIVEAVDQTRGWFYTLLAVATLLGKGTPYKNVISLGHVLDKYGQKMSKSKGNAVDPKEMIQKYGADALRWYFYTLNSPGEPKRFDEKDLFNKLRGFLMTLWNCFALFETYVDKISNKSKARDPKIKNVLDRWILRKLDALIADATKKLDQYDILGAARSIEEFTVNDFSQWYLRRSRRRFQRPETIREKEEAAETTAYVLVTLAKLLAPFAPFLGEALYRELRKKMKLEAQSVHLTDWPKIEARSKKQEARILLDMEWVRKIAAEALKLRAAAGIKVRQPLAKLQIRNTKYEIRNTELLELIREEVNVKEVTFGSELNLDTVITPELKEEGIAREIIRNIQEMRRDLGLSPRDKIRVQFSGDKNLEPILERWKKMIMADAGVKQIVIGGKKSFQAERELDFEGKPLWVGIEI